MQIQLFGTYCRSALRRPAALVVEQFAIQQQQQQSSRRRQHQFGDNEEGDFDDAPQKTHR